MKTGAEAKVGLIVVLVLVLLGVYVVHVRGLRVVAATYPVRVVFDDARGLQAGDPVRMVGVKIGEVRSVEIDPQQKAETLLSIYAKHKLYDNYLFRIASSGLIQERFVEVSPMPEEPSGMRLHAGASVKGVTSPGFESLVKVSTEVLQNLDRTARLLNAVLSDQEIVGGVKDALERFSDAAASAAQLADTMSGLAADSRADIQMTLGRVENASRNVEAFTEDLQARLREGSTFGDIEVTARELRETAGEAHRLAKSLADIAADPALQESIPDTLADVRAAARSLRTVGENLEVFTAELRKAAPAVPRVISEAEQVVEVSAALRERLKPPEIKASFDLLYSGLEDRIFPSGQLDIVTSPDRFVRFGVDDIGEESDANIQLGERRSLGVLRYGLVRSRLGVGFDFDLPRNSVLSLDLFDPNDVRADILADFPLLLGRSDVSFVTGVRDIGEDSLFVAGLRFRREQERSMLAPRALTEEEAR